MILEADLLLFWNDKICLMQQHQLSRGEHVWTKGLQLEVWQHHPSGPPGSHQGQANPKAGTLVALNHLVLGIVLWLLVTWNLPSRCGVTGWVGKRCIKYIYVFNSINIAWRRSPDGESRAWPCGWVTRWLANWSQQLSLCTQTGVTVCVWHVLDRGRRDPA